LIPNGAWKCALASRLNISETTNAGAEAVSPCAAVHGEAPSESASSEVTTPSGGEPKQSTPATDPPSLVVSPSTAPVQAYGFGEMVDSHRPHISSLLNTDDALRIIPSILLHCAQ
jgi:hypothetical protein